jgi:F0F1-type ATP synthase membrane subunit a
MESIIAHFVLAIFAIVLLANIFGMIPESMTNTCEWQNIRTHRRV